MRTYYYDHCKLVGLFLNFFKTFCDIIFGEIYGDLYTCRCIILGKQLLSKKSGSITDTVVDRCLSSCLPENFGIELGCDLDQ